MHKKLLARGGPLGVFTEYPILLRFACICVCAEIAWATLIIVMEYYFKDTLLRGQNEQLIASRVALALLAFTTCECVFKVPMGALSDRIGPRPIVISALGLAAVSPLLMVFATQWYHFMPLRAIDGFCAAALWPSMSALMARSVPREAKAAAMSVFNAAYCFGLAIGPAAGLFLGHLIGNRFVFPFCSLVLLTGSAIAYTVLRAAPAAKPHHNAATAAPEGHAPWPEGPADEAVALPVSGVANMNGKGVPAKRPSLLRGRPMLVKMMVLYAISQTAVGILATTLPIYISGPHDAPLSWEYPFNIQQGDLPRMIAIPALLIALVAVPLGRVADSIGRPQAIWISYVLATVGMLLASVTNLLWVFGVGILLLVMSYILGTPAWLGLTSLQVDETRQAVALSLMQTAQGVGVVAGLGMVAAAGHFMVNDLPLDVWMYVATAVFAVCLIGTLLWVREPEHSPEAEQAAKSAKQPLEITGV